MRIKVKQNKILRKRKRRKRKRRRDRRKGKSRKGKRKKGKEQEKGRVICRAQNGIGGKAINIFKPSEALSTEGADTG